MSIPQSVIEFAHSLEVRAIPGFEDYYITENGDVISMKSGLPYKLKPLLGRTGYFEVHLKGDDYKVHHLVLLAFCGERPAGPPQHIHARHLDGNPQNNHYSNLAWGTSSENARDRIMHGKHNRKALTPEDVRAIRAELSTGKSLSQIGREFGVTGALVGQIKRGVVWGWLD